MVVQDAFYIDENISLKLLTGEYRRIGSVVRYATGPHKGKIVKHLYPIELPDNPKVAQSVGAKVLQFVKDNKTTLLIVGAGIAVVGTVTGICYEVKKAREPKVLSNFRIKLKIYINKVRKGNVEGKNIKELIDCIEELKKHKEYEKIQIQLSVDELDVLVNQIWVYTLKLANSNSFNIEKQVSCGDAIKNLNHYLYIQRDIFAKCA